MNDFPTLQTQRLVLREIVETDAEQLLAIHGDAEHMKWFGTDPIPDLGAAKKLVATFAGWRQAPNPGTRWGIELRDGPGLLIGTCGLFAWNKNWKKCAVGYEISPAHARRGLMAEALAAIFAWGFEDMQLNRIEAHVHPENSASLRLLGKLGFVEEGRLREVGYWAGRHHDLLQYSLLRADWRGLASAASVR